MRVGLFGGSFDPVHYGHLLLAECCREQCRLDRVLFLPAAVPPHKQDHPLAPAAQRVEMLQLAIAGHPAFAVACDEIQRGGVSYTIDTLRQYRNRHPEDELFLVMGADMLNDLPAWREAAAVCQLALPVVAARPDMVEPDLDRLRPLVPPHRLEQIRRHRVEMPAIGISSTQIRQRVARGLSIRYWTPRAVEKYIEAHRLYAAGH